MVKSTNGGKTKATSGETKVRRAPAPRKTAKKTVETRVAVAADSARPGQVAATALKAEEIQRRAYEIYVSRGCTGGCDVDDWLEAERQLRGRTR